MSMDKGNGLRIERLGGNLQHPGRVADSVDVASNEDVVNLPREGVRAYVGDKWRLAVVVVGGDVGEVVVFSEGVKEVGVANSSRLVGCSWALASMKHMDCAL